MSFNPITQQWEEEPDWEDVRKQTLYNSYDRAFGSPVSSFAQGLGEQIGGIIHYGEDKLGTGTKVGSNMIDASRKYLLPEGTRTGYDRVANIMGGAIPAVATTAAAVANPYLGPLASATLGTVAGNAIDYAGEIGRIEKNLVDDGYSGQEYQDILDKAIEDERQVGTASILLGLGLGGLGRGASKAARTNARFGKEVLVPRGAREIARTKKGVKALQRGEVMFTGDQQTQINERNRR